MLLRISSTMGLAVMVFKMYRFLSFSKLFDLIFSSLVRMVSAFVLLGIPPRRFSTWYSTDSFWML